MQGVMCVGWGIGLEEADGGWGVEGGCSGGWGGEGRVVRVAVVDGRVLEGCYG